MRGLFVGTFDPPTLGHIAIIERAAALCDHLTVGIGENLAKSNHTLSPAERQEALQTSLAHLTNVTITPFSGLTTTFAKECNATALIRALRSAHDLSFESEMAFANAEISSLETLFLLADPKHTPISSSLIKELAAAKTPLDAFVPKELEPILHNRLQTRK